MLKLVTALSYIIITEIQVVIAIFKLNLEIQDAIKTILIIIFF